MVDLRADLLLLALSILFNVAGQLSLKRAAIAGGAPDSGMSHSLFSPFYFGGAACLGVALLTWVQVLRHMPLTLAHPISGAVFVLVPLGSHLIWREPLGASRMIGILVIVIGVILVARG